MISMRARRLILGAVLPAALLAAWWLGSRNSEVVPSIGAVLKVLFHPLARPVNLDSSSLADGTFITLFRVVVGLSLAIFISVPLGVLAGRLRFLDEILSPVFTLLMVVSPVAWMPLAILIFGFSSPATLLAGDNAWQYPLLEQLRWAIILVIWLGASFPIIVNTIDGVRGVRVAHIESARMLGATHWQVLYKIILPSAAPSIMTGLRLGGGVAWRVIIAAELFPGTRGGLGYMIATSHQQASYEYAFAAVIIIAAIGLILDGSLRLAAARVGHWRTSQR